MLDLLRTDIQVYMSALMLKRLQAVVPRSNAAPTMYIDHHATCTCKGGNADAAKSVTVIGHRTLYLPYDDMLLQRHALHITHSHALRLRLQD